MAFTYDLATDIGRVRNLIHDKTQETAIFTDEEIQGFLDLESDVLNTAALALETIAGQQAYVIKVIKILDLQMDGSKVAEALLAAAKRLRERAEKVEDDSWCGFEIAETIDNSPFAWSEKQWKLLMEQEA